MVSGNGRTGLERPRAGSEHRSTAGIGQSAAPGNSAAATARLRRNAARRALIAGFAAACATPPAPTPAPVVRKG
ncbi:MAG: hypothetical protein BGP06_18080 [Rhizobiales bacterium 65-9]|nr:MAG: hypothetical protein BGP06_18080 [Rhizobiales bacterium 65-9]